MECSRCGSDNRQGAKFCLQCGERLEQDCPQCGKKLRAAANFCDECGHRLRTSNDIHSFDDPGERTETSGTDNSHPASSIPQSLADKILTSRSALEGERKLVTVLFADVADFASLSEKLDPEKIHEIMDGCLRLLVDEIYRYEGTINQYTGDGIMAIFGAPVAHEDHAQRACHAALSLRKPIEQYGERMRRDYGVDFRLRMGMNSGLVRVGSIGDDLHMEYTAVGDTTNLAARMQAMAKPGSPLVSGNTYKLAGDYFKFKPLGKLSFKGKEVPLEAYELLDTSDVETRIGAAAIRGLTKFVGREHELDRLREAFEKVRSGSGRVVGLAGEAGIGKSRLILKLKGMLQGREFLYLEGQCLHYGSSTAYLPILDILRSYFNIKEGLHEHTVKGRMEEKIDALDEGLRYLLPPLHELLSDGGR